MRNAEKELSWNEHYAKCPSKLIANITHQDSGRYYKDMTMLVKKISKNFHLLKVVNVPVLPQTLQNFLRVRPCFHVQKQVTLLSFLA